jgi:hypothetical protein
MTGHDLAKKTFKPVAQKNLHRPCGDILQHH